MSTRAKIHDTLERLERWLREHQPAFLAAMRPGATDTELDDLERAIGRQLPDDVRAFYRWRDGINEGAPAAWSGCPFWNHQPMTVDHIRQCYGCAIHDWHDPARPGWWHPAWVPIMANDNSDYLCVDTEGVWTGDRGQIIQYWHDMTMRPVESAGLGEWLVLLVEDLERGQIFAPNGDLREDVRNRHPIGYPLFMEAGDPAFIPDSDHFGIGDRIRVTDSASSFANQEGNIVRCVQGTWKLDVDVVTHRVTFQAGQLSLIERAAPGPLAGEWDTGRDPERLFDLLGYPISPRKLRLFAVGWGRRFFHALPPIAERLAEKIEHVTDGLAPDSELDDAFVEFRRVVDADPITWSSAYTSWEPLRLAGASFQSSNTKQIRAAVQFATDSLKLIREIFPNPFAPTCFDPAWRTADVVALAQGIYDDRAFERMPILADALQEAGCDNADILAHCRDANQVHVRGCWALDLCLGLE